MNRRSTHSQRDAREVVVVKGFMQSDRELINSNYKEIRKEGAALSQSSLRVKIIRRLIINKNS